MSHALHMVRRWRVDDNTPAAAQGATRWAAQDTNIAISTDAPGTAPQVRRLTATDVDAVAQLFWRGFGTQGPDGFASPDAARTEAQRTLHGRWGPVIWDASLLALGDVAPAAAAVVVRDDAHDLVPLLAFLVTDPAHRHRGLATILVETTVARLSALGLTELHLAVDASNPARALYHRLGFTDEPRQRPAPSAK